MRSRIMYLGSVVLVAMVMFSSASTQKCRNDEIPVKKNFDLDRRCVAESWTVLSRNRTGLSRAHEEFVHHIIGDLCLDLSDFVVIDQTKDCPYSAGRAPIMAEVTMRSRIMYLGSVVLVVMVMFSSASTQKCRNDEIPVKKNFDLDRFMGVWFEIKLTIPPIPDFELNDNFKYIFTKQSKTRVELVSRSRVIDSDPGDECVELDVDSWMDIKGMSGKFQRSRKSLYGTGRDQLDFWVIDTDYDNYALAFVCYEPNQGVYMVDSWTVLSRKRTGLSTTHEDIVHDIIGDLCPDLSDFVVIDQTNDCPYSAGRALIPMPYIMIILVLTGLLTKSSS